MAAVERADAYDTLDLVGIHAHIGSNIFSYDPFGKTVEIMFDFLADVEKVLGLTVEEVNLGGGLGIPYIAGDFPIRLDLLAKLITETAEHEAARHAIPVPRLAFEPGRFLVGNAMVTLYSVGVVKDIPGMRTYVSVDGGMSDNIRPALYQARYAALLEREPQRREPLRHTTQEQRQRGELPRDGKGTKFKEFVISHGSRPVLAFRNAASTLHCLRPLEHYS